jgi:hypothetical protein
LRSRGVGVLDALAGTDEDLAHHRLDVPGRLGQAAVVARHVAPAEHSLPFLADGTLDFLLAGAAAGLALRQEHHTDAVLAEGRQDNALLRHFLAQERIRSLDQDAGAVAEQRIVAGGATVLEVLQDLQALLDDRVALAIPDVDDETDATGVVLVGGIIKTLLLGEGHLSFLNSYLPRPVSRRAVPHAGRAIGRGREKSRRIVGRTGFS